MNESNTHFIYIGWLGRLANQLLAWANARHATRNLSSYTLIVNYKPLVGACVMPKTEIRDMTKPSWPVVKTSGLGKQNCIWEDGWGYCATEGVKPSEFLKEIQWNQKLTDRATALIGQDRVIGVHIRYGDYVRVDPANPPKETPPFVRLPDDYYTNVVDYCLKVLPGYRVLLCTDGTPEEIAWFVDRYHPLRQPENDGVLDFITLSRCRLIIASGSTFAPTAAALRDVPYVYPYPQSVEQLDLIIRSAADK